MSLPENTGVAPRQGLGRTGERLAAEELSRRGYRILERNFRCRYGEIDLVAEQQGELVFVEVKTRRGDAWGRPEEAVTLQKQQKIVRAALCYLELHGCVEQAWRVDVVAVQMSVRGKLEEIRVYEYAFSIEI
ncbi:MAG TPA: YraN family protein [Ktedonobacteraceae bacterium]